MPKTVSTDILEVTPELCRGIVEDFVKTQWFKAMLTMQEAESYGRGLALADGHRRGSGIRFCMAPIAEPVLVTLGKTFASFGGVRKECYKGRSMVRLTISFKGWWKDTMKDLDRHAVRGYLEGDGCITKGHSHFKDGHYEERKRVQFLVSTAQPSISEWLAGFFKENDLRCCRYMKTLSKGRTQPIEVFEFFGKHAEKILTLLYKDSCIDFKGGN